MEEIKDEQLKDFLEWYHWHYRKGTAFEAAIQMSLMGHFHLGVRQTRPLLQRCLALGFIQKARNGLIHLNV